MQIRNIVSGLVAALFVCVTFADVAALEFCGNKMHKDTASEVETIPTGAGHSEQNCQHHGPGECPFNHSDVYSGSGGKVCYISKCAPHSSEKENVLFTKKIVIVRQIFDLPHPETDSFSTTYRWLSGTGRTSVEPRPPTA